MTGNKINCLHTLWINATDLKSVFVKSICYDIVNEIWTLCCRWTILQSQLHANGHCHQEQYIQQHRQCVDVASSVKWLAGNIVAVIFKCTLNVPLNTKQTIYDISSRNIMKALIMSEIYRVRILFWLWTFFICLIRQYRVQILVLIWSVTLSFISSFQLLLRRAVIMLSELCG